MDTDGFILFNLFKREKNHCINFLNNLWLENWQKQHENINKSIHFIIKIIKNLKYYSSIFKVVLIERGKLIQICDFLSILLFVLGCNLYVFTAITIRILLTIILVVWFRTALLEIPDFDWCLNSSLKFGSQFRVLLHVSGHNARHYNSFKLLDLVLFY